MPTVRSLSTEETSLLSLLETRFRKHMHRHTGVDWTDVFSRLQKNPQKIQTLAAMEQTGGEPDVVLLESRAGAWCFVDCAAESPKERRSICYDEAALEARKAHKPWHSAVGLAAEMGVEILTEADYRALQLLEPFDTKTSSWVHTPEAIRELGGALFCDRRFNTVFTYHNGVESYYGGRGFRGLLRV